MKIGWSGISSLIGKAGCGGPADLVDEPTHTIICRSRSGGLMQLGKFIFANLDREGGLPSSDRCDDVAKDR
jgi:hypothetical protein